MSVFKLSLKVNSRAMALFLAQKKEKERRLVCKRKRDARRQFQAYVRRRRFATQLFVLLLTRNFFPLPPVRKIWTKPRTTTFWEETCQRWNDQDWKEIFRISRVAFEYLTTELSPIISKRDTNFRKAISARQRLAVTLYRLADTATYDCKPFCIWEVHRMRNRCAGMQCYCTIPSSEVHTSSTISTRNSGKD